MSKNRFYRWRRARVRSCIAAAPVLVAVALWSCDQDSPDAPTGPARSEAASSARQPSKNALIAFSSNRETDYAIYTMTPTGHRQARITDPAMPALWPTWAPDHRQLAFQSPLLHSHIFAVNADGSTLRQLTNDSVFNDVNPRWSPDGAKIAFERNGQIMIMNADGSNPTAVPHGEQDSDAFPSWSSDGTKLAVARDRGFREIEQVWVISVDGTQEVQLTSGNFQNTAPQWSPDGTRIAFVTNRDGLPQVYVMNPDGTGQTRVTNEVGSSDNFAWSPDGKQMVVRAQGDLWVMNADGTRPTRLTTDPADDGTPAWAQ
jgi:Tol biopolymer transport system component